MAYFGRSFISCTATFVFTFLLYLLNVEESLCTLNLFLDKTESHRFLGIPNEIYYIQAGRVQKNALEHVLKVPENFHIVHYTWESLTSIPYAIDVEISDKKLLRSVTLNVSNQGVVPSTKETVMIQFTCSGLQTAQVVVDFNLKFVVENSSVIEITFKRKKFCVKEAQNISFNIDQQPLTDSSDSSQLKIFYIVLCLGCSLFTLLVLCFLAYMISSKKDSRQNSLHAEQQIRLRHAETENVPYILSASAINSGTSTSSNISHSSVKKRKNYTQLDNRSLDLQDRISEITIQRKRIRLQKIELEGTFGRVFVGTYAKEDGSEEDVVVKTVMDFASSNQISLLLREGLTMYGLKHKNIMSVLGVSIEDHVEPFVIYLRENFTNLKKYLQKCKLCQEGITHMLTTQEVVEIALQIIAGIQYMHKKKLLHRDVATRNCLSYGAPLFLDYRRKNSVRAKYEYDELVRERLRQIGTETRHVAKTRADMETEQLHRDERYICRASKTTTTTTTTTKTRLNENNACSVSRQLGVDDTENVKDADADANVDGVFLAYNGESEKWSAVAPTSTSANVEIASPSPAKAKAKAQEKSAATKASPTGRAKPGVKSKVSDASYATKSGRVGSKSPPSIGPKRNTRDVATGDTNAGATKKSLSAVKEKSLASADEPTTSFSTGKKSAKRDPTTTAAAAAAAATAATATATATTNTPTSTFTQISTRRRKHLEGASDGDDVPTNARPASVARTSVDETPPPTNAVKSVRTTACGANPPRSPSGSSLSSRSAIKQAKTTSATRKPFSNPIAFPATTAPSASLSDSERAQQMEREKKLERVWRLVVRRISKTVSLPVQPPSSLRQPPTLVFERTRTFELRRDLSRKHGAGVASTPHKSSDRGKIVGKYAYIEPKTNLTQNLRYKQLKRQPIFSEFFEKCYTKYKKPPFRLIDASLNIKVADNALSRDLFPNDYHCLGDNENRPVKWLAIESLMHRTFSTASDVWSFGVTLWELTTLGQQPYVEVDPFEIEHYLKDGYRLSQPVNCPDELFAVMAYCWAMSADERPTFSQLLTCLQDFRNQLNKYV